VTLSRRDFLSTAAAGAAALGLERRSFAAQPKYDLLIRGGRVIDPSLHLDGIRDVAITAGRIVLVDANITAEAADTIDARGRLVVPGLIDIHTHGLETAAGPPMMLEDGVTGYVVNAVDEAVEATRRALELDRSRCRSAFDTRFTARRMAEDYLAVYRSASQPPGRDSSRDETP